MHAGGRRFEPCHLQRGIKMKRWIKEWWTYIAGTAAIIGLFVLLVVSVNLLISDFNKAGGFHTLGVSIGKGMKSIMEEIDREENKSMEEINED